MLRILAGLLMVWEPWRFATEALMVAPSVADRGALAGIELFVHGLVAALAAAAGLALWNGSPDGRRLALIAVAALVLRVLQSLYWSVLPNNTVPGDEPLVAGAALGVGCLVVLGLRVGSSG